MTDLDDDHYLPNDPDVLNGAAQSQLRSFVERLERLSEDAVAVRTDMKEVRAEAKGSGFDTKILNRVIKARAADKAKRQEEDAIFDLYMSALGEF